MSATIYRVIRERYIEPGVGRYRQTQKVEVLYCGTDRDAARIAYHASTPTDRTGMAGDLCVETRVQRIRERMAV